MTTYIVSVDEQGTFALPKEVQEDMQLRPGETVQVSIERVAAETSTPNQEMRALLAWIEEQHATRPYTDPSDTDRLIREARDGGMYTGTDRVDYETQSGAMCNDERAE